MECRSYRFIVRELGNLTTQVEDANRPVEWNLIEQVLLSSSEPYNCTSSQRISCAVAL